jgi:hypothetical protein
VQFPVKFKADSRHPILSLFTRGGNVPSRSLALELAPALAAALAPALALALALAPALALALALAPALALAHAHASRNRTPHAALLFVHQVFRHKAWQGPKKAPKVN